MTAVLRTSTTTKSRVRIALSLVLGIALSSCATARDATRNISIARGATFDLLPAADLGHAISLEQMVTARHAAETTTLHCVLEVEPSQLRLVALTPFDSPAFVVELDEHGLRVDNRIGQRLPADPRQVLADLQLALWPSLPSLRGLTVEEHATSDGGCVRELLRGAQVVVRINYGPGLAWEHPLHFENLERGYNLTVETLRCDELTP